MIGRIEEIAALKDVLDSGESQFVAVYGRRRVGKTYLVRETLGAHFVFENVGLYDGTLAEELATFRKSLVKWGARNVPSEISSWCEAFDCLEDLLKSSHAKRKVLFLDEMPWMETPNSGFLKALDHFWNSFATARKDVVLVVCGSAASWIIKKVVRNKGGLHNRLTEIIWLRPFTLCECEQFALSRGLRMSRRELAECYMIFGGVPYYWSWLKRRNSLAQNIDTLCFAEGGKLRKEFESLYRSLFSDSALHLAVVKALATVRAGMTRSDILGHLGVTGKNDGGAYTRCLDDLCESGFVRKYTAHGCKAKGSVYQLIDNFTLFHFRFIADKPNPDAHFWTLSMKAQPVVVWKGLAFERLCLWHIPQIKAALGISGVLTEVYAWRHEPDDVRPWGVQIDLLLDRADRVINVCEMKYVSGEYVIDAETERALVRKCETFGAVTKTKCAVHLTLVTTQGVVRNAHSGVVQSEVTLDDLFRP